MSEISKEQAQVETQEIEPSKTEVLQEQASQEEKQPSLLLLLWDLRKENHTLRAVVEAVKVAKEALKQQLSAFEEPVEGQVPSEVFVGLQARTRIKEAALRNKDRRFFSKELSKSGRSPRHRRPSSRNAAKHARSKCALSQLFVTSALNSSNCLANTRSNRTLTPRATSSGLSARLGLSFL